MHSRGPNTLIFLAAALLLGINAKAGSFTSDFGNPNQTGFVLNGDAVIENGYLVLTPALGSKQGSIVFDDIDPGRTISAFTVSYKVRLGGGTSDPADGMAFYFGSDIDVTANFGEEGPEPSTSGITVSFDTYNNGNNEAPAIDVKVNGTTVAHKNVSVFLLLSDTFTNVVVQLNNNGTLNLAYKDQVIYTNLYLTGYTPITGGRFALGARTGGAWSTHWVDDLQITTTVAGAGQAPAITTQPASQTVPEHGSVTFTAGFTGTAPLTFQWMKNGVNLAGATEQSLTLTNVPGSDNGAKFKVQITNAQGSATSDEATLTVQADTEVPTVVSVTGSATFNTITVVFSEPVSPGTATQAGNYKFDKGLTVSSASLTTPTTVTLTTSAQTPGELYTLTINGVQDTASTPNTIAADTRKTVSAWVIVQGFLKFSYWGGLSTSDYNMDNTLLADPRYPASPDAVYYTSSFSSRPVFPDDSHEGYGAVISGWVTPPESGDYRFFLSSDDLSRLFVSSDDSPANLTQVAELTTCCTGFTEPEVSMTSWPITLTAGKKYYVEAIYTEGGGGDYCFVAWRKEGDPTPAGSLAPIPSQFLSTLANPDLASITFDAQPTDVSTTENKSATFGVTVTASPAPVLYQWQRAEPNSSTFNNIAGATARSYTTPALKRANDDGAKYRVVVSVPGKSAVSVEAALAVDIDTTPATVVEASGGENLRSVTVVFSEAVDPVSAAVSANYTINGLSVTGAALVAPNTVLLTTSEQAQETLYTVVVTNVKDTAIPANTIGTTGNSATFTSMILLRGAMKWEAFTGIGSDVSISALTSVAKYPDQPDEVRLVPGYEGPANFGDNYGARIKGFITPTQTGDYVFYVATDDHGELWLSTDDTAQNKTRRAVEPNWSNPRQWTGPDGGGRPGCDAGQCENVTAPIHLEAGKRYYTELLYKEGGGGDHGAVAWKLASAADPANGSAPIWGDVVSVALDRATLDRLSLPLSAGSKPGTGVSNQRGFKARIYQVDQAGTVGLQANFYRAEQELAGIIGPNVADLTGAVNGVFAADVINWNQDAPGPIGNFEDDLPIPGIPGTGSQDYNTDNIAAEIITYVEFPSAGVYVMGVNSDDGFKVTLTDQPPASNGSVTVTSPASAAASYYALSAGTDYGGVFKPITEPIVGELVAADPIDACSALLNAAALKGKIALVDRGVCTFSSKVQATIDAGAIAAIVVNSRDPGSGEGIFPIIMGGVYVDAPAVMISKPDGAKLKAALATGPVMVHITPDFTPAVGAFLLDRGSADTVFSFRVAQPGLYPFRLVWYEGGGGANVEWFTRSADGAKWVLLNSTDPAALKTYRAWNFTPIAEAKPQIGIAKLEGGTLTLEYSGVLQAADQVTGPWLDVPNATSPYNTTVTTEVRKFWRTRTP